MSADDHDGASAPPTTGRRGFAFLYFCVAAAVVLAHAGRCAFGSKGGSAAPIAPAGGGITLSSRKTGTLVLPYYQSAADWLSEPDRRRQEAAFLRGIVRSRGSQRQAVLATGISARTISRILDRDGPAKLRAAAKETRHSEPTFQNVDSPEPDDEPEEIMPTNVVKLKRRRPDWKPRHPRRAETYRWMQQFLGWTLLAREKAMLLIQDSKGDLPDEPSGGSRRPPFCAGSKGREGRSAKPRPPPACITRRSRASSIATRRLAQMIESVVVVSQVFKILAHPSPTNQRRSCRQTS
jgi:hypothetical protein